MIAPETVMGTAFAVILSSLGYLNAAPIVDLPNAPTVQFRQYSGYLNTTNTHHMFYWYYFVEPAKRLQAEYGRLEGTGIVDKLRFAESQRNSTADPLILWIHGGPGCSGLSALLTENGPFTVMKGGHSLEMNENSWNNFANFLVIESPIGVGYSYADDDELYNDDEAATDENWRALKAFFAEHAEFLNNDFYIIGESYGGITVPLLAEKILQNQEDLYINLKGIGIGNAYVSKSLNLDTLILTWQRASRECCNGETNYCAFSNFSGWDFCGLFVQETLQNMGFDGLYLYDIYLKCDTNDGATERKGFSTAPDDNSKSFRKQLPKPFYGSNSLCWNEPRDSIYLNTPEVRKAIHLPDSVQPWYSCSSEVYDHYEQIIYEMKAQVKALAEAGIRILLYNGDTDMICNFLQGQRFIDDLGFQQTSPKSIYRVNGQVGGFYTEYGTVGFATIRNAGHMAPAEKPHVVAHIISAFLKSQSP